MSALKIKYVIPIFIGKQNPTTIYVDKDVILTLELKWVSNDKISEIKLTLENRVINMFKICYAKLCTNQPIPDHPEYIIMQLSNKLGHNQKSDFLIDLTTNPIDFKAKKELKFFFNITPGDCLDVEKYSCKFNQGIPETKGGSVIVGG